MCFVCVVPLLVVVNCHPCVFVVEDNQDSRDNGSMEGSAPILSVTTPCSGTQVTALCRGKRVRALRGVQLQEHFHKEALCEM